MRSGHKVSVTAVALLVVVGVLMSAVAVGDGTAFARHVRVEPGRSESGAVPAPESGAVPAPEPEPESEPASVLDSGSDAAADPGADVDSGANAALPAADPDGPSGFGEAPPAGPPAPRPGDDDGLAGDDVASDDVSPEPRVTLVVGTSRVLAIPDVKRVAVANPDIADVTVVSNSEILVVGEAPGRTSLHVWRGRDAPDALQVDVVLERAARIEMAIGEPDVHVRVYNGTVLLEGTVATSFARTRAESIARAFSDRVENLLRTAPVTILPPSQRPDAAGRDVDPSDAADPAMAAPPEPPQNGAGGPAADGALTRRAADREAESGADARSERKAERLATLKELIGNADVRLHTVDETLVVQGIVSSESEVHRVTELASLLFPRAIVALTVNEYAGNDLARVVQGAIELDGVRVRQGIEGRLILDGQVATQRERERAVRVAEAYSSDVTDLLELRNPLQVLLGVRVVEVKRTIAHEWGTQWGSIERGVFNSYVVPFSEGFGPIPPFDLGKSAPVAVRLQMLAETGDATLLASPSLVTLSGEEADFLAGGEVPVGIPEDDRVTVQWKEYGVKLNIVPEVMEGDEIHVKLEPEVSTLDWANGIRINGATLPALSTRRASSTLRIRSGDTIVLGGLLQSEESRQVQKLPLLGDLPIVGRLFQSETFEKGQSELLIFVTPRILADGGEPNE